MCKRCEGKIVLTAQELTEMLRAAGQPQPMPALVPTRTVPFIDPHRFNIIGVPDQRLYPSSNLATVTWIVGPDDGAAGVRVPA